MPLAQEVRVIHVMLADDQPAIQRALREELAPHPELHIEAVAASFQEVLDQLSIGVPDVLVLDIGGMGSVPLSFVIGLRRSYPRLHVIVYSSTLSIMPEMLTAGVLSFVAKEDLDHLVQAIMMAYAGKEFLSPTAEEYLARSRGQQRAVQFTPEQKTILQYMVQGCTTAEIAALMGIDERTVLHLTELAKRQTGSVTRQELIKWYRHNGMN